MPLVQLLVSSSAANNNTNFVVPVSGKCSIRILSVVFHHTEANTNSRAIQVRSDILQFPYSPLKWLTFISNPSATLAIDNGFQEYNINNAVLQGQLGINVVQSDGTDLPAGTWRLLLTMQIEKIGEDFNQMTNTSHPSR